MKIDKHDNPGYKILDKGVNALSDVETLSIIISGTESIAKAQMLLDSCGHNLNMLAKLSYHDMIRDGLSHTQATRMIAMNEYSKRKRIQEYPERIHIRTSNDVAEIFFPILSDLEYEEFWILFLNRATRVIAKEMMSRGGINGTVTDQILILRKAIDHKASGMIICHNHPSGNIEPSESDRKITNKIKESGIILDIQLLDHVIISDNKHYSFADNGLL